MSSTTLSRAGRDATSTMSGSKAPHYEAVKTLSGLLADSINALSFSSNGASLAAGGDDKSVVLLKVPSGKEYARFNTDSSINVLVWGSFAAQEEVLCGTRSGQIFSLDPTKKRSPVWISALEGAIRVIGMPAGNDASLIAVGHGTSVTVFRQQKHHHWQTWKTLIEPSFPNSTNYPRPTPYPVSIHFKSRNEVIVGYISYGVVDYDLIANSIRWSSPPTRVGSSAISKDERLLVSTNLYDGIDWYHVVENGIQLKTTSLHRIDVNIIRKIIFIHEDKYILVGGDDGSAYIIDVKSQALVQELKHGRKGEFIQTVAFCTMSNGEHLIATGNSERGAATTIKLWAISGSWVAKTPGDKFVTILATLLVLWLTFVALSYIYQLILRILGHWRTDSLASTLMNAHKSAEEWESRALQNYDEFMKEVEQTFSTRT